MFESAPQYYICDAVVMDKVMKLPDKFCGIFGVCFFVINDYIHRIKFWGKRTQLRAQWMKFSLTIYIVELYVQCTLYMHIPMRYVGLRL